MNLKIEEGVVTLNGEPLQDWYTKRGITPVEMRYLEQAEGKCKMCLLAAMGFSAVEARKTIEQYHEDYKSSGKNFTNYVAYLLGVDKLTTSQLELGFLSIKASELPSQQSKSQQLGYAARKQLKASIGIDKR